MAGECARGEARRGPQLRIARWRNLRAGTKGGPICAVEGRRVARPRLSMRSMRSCMRETTSSNTSCSERAREFLGEEGGPLGSSPACASSHTPAGWSSRSVLGSVFLIVERKASTTAEAPLSLRSIKPTTSACVATFSVEGPSSSFVLTTISSSSFLGTSTHETAPSSTTPKRSTSTSSVSMLSDSAAAASAAASAASASANSSLRRGMSFILDSSANCTRRPAARDLLLAVDPSTTLWGSSSLERFCPVILTSALLEGLTHAWAGSMTRDEVSWDLCWDSSPRLGSLWQAEDWSSSCVLHDAAAAFPSARCP
mmetsp:Transcript_15002/g.35556  ORF Transcript_15002/g.35556 Transcript_15002/m.35556 type:complete len:313 (+) Transcript_15002:221-1159(+)